jgi:hypothetical protein
MKLAVHEPSGRPGHTERTWAASVYQVVVAELARGVRRAEVTGL